jgi:hypothetical protein
MEKEPHLDGQERGVPPTRRPHPCVQTALDRLDEDDEARRRGVFSRSFGDAGRSGGPEENLVVPGMLLGESAREEQSCKNWR